MQVPPAPNWVWWRYVSPRYGEIHACRMRVTIDGTTSAGGTVTPCRIEYEIQLRIPSNLTHPVRARVQRINDLGEGVSHTYSYKSVEML